MHRRSYLTAILLGLAAWAPVSAIAHNLTITQILVSFDQPGTVDIKIDIDLTVMLPSPGAYYAMSVAAPDAQRAAVENLLPGILDSLQLHVGDEQLRPVLQDFALPKLTESDFSDPTIDHFTTLNFIAILPARHDPMRLVVPYTAKVDYPVAFIVQIPSAHISETNWVEEGSNESELFDWADLAPKAGSANAAAPPSGGAPGAAPAAAPSRARPTFDVDTMPWTRQLPMYLSLGFHHIVPEGTDHILFVLGLFFLGITWRKLLFQTTTFTVAHATTLFLSTYGIFSLPSKYVEPAIALSIAFIALENVFNPRLGPGRLAVVFSFGLIHGLGFASSLSEVPFPSTSS
jgi:hypothetical protein